MTFTKPRMKRETEAVEKLVFEITSFEMLQPTFERACQWSTFCAGGISGRNGCATCLAIESGESRACVLDIGPALIESHAKTYMSIHSRNL